jgi:hypothetical protein
MKGEMMGQSPFARKGLFPQARPNRRRSTRIDYEVPVVLSGRDATGQTFREETTTLIVNFHGAKVRTSRQVLVGMMVTVENVRAGQGGKAVCVQVHEAEPGATTHAIALQLVHPGNIWGVENPPADWDSVAAELGGRNVSPQESAGRPAGTVMRPPAAPPVDQPPVGEVLREVVSAQVASLEKRAGDIVNTAAQNLRGKSDDVVSEVHREFHQQLEVMVKAAERRNLQAMEVASAQFGSALETLKGEALAEISRETLRDFEKHLGSLVDGAEARINACAERATNDLQSAAATLKSDALPAIIRDALQDFEEKLGDMMGGAETQMNSRTEKVAADFQAALETLRSEAMGDVAREAVTDFEQRIANLSSENEKRIAQRMDEAFAELETALATFRSGLGDELTAQKEQVLQSSEQALRARVAAMLSSVLTPAGNVALPEQLHPAEKK